jgi:hypothetical protein
VEHDEMEELSVFVSVGETATAEQETFVRAVEERLRSEGIVPHTVGRNTFSADAPLNTVSELMDKCSGAMVIALERSFFISGTEKRGGPGEVTLRDVKLPTPWNQIEAAMAYSRGLPLMVIVESGLNAEGLLERGHSWYVQRVNPTPASLHSNEFNGVVASWKEKMVHRPSRSPSSKSVAEFTLMELIRGLKPAHLWSILSALATLAAGAFALGGQLFRVK